MGDQIVQAAPIITVLTTTMTTNDAPRVADRAPAGASYP